ncbi:MAG TPA: hypothetical protein VI322_04780 [Candidatus Saccharimonadia bacterium]
MLLVGFFRWWYSRGWRDTASRLSAQLTTTYLMFSVPTLVTTLFEPWRRIVTEPGAGLEAHARALVDNLVSRLVGGIMRGCTLIGAGLIIGAYAVIGGAVLLLWPVLPFLGPALIIWGSRP